MDSTAACQDAVVECAFYMEMHWHFDSEDKLKYGADSDIADAGMTKSDEWRLSQ